MKIYLVNIGEDWEDPDITMPFKTKELALEFIDSFYNRPDWYYYIDEYEVMETLDAALSNLGAHRMRRSMEAKK